MALHGPSSQPRTMPESPTWPIYNLLFLMMAMLAVVPEVEGSPLTVRGHLSVRDKAKISLTCVNMENIMFSSFRFETKDHENNNYLIKNVPTPRAL